MCQRWIIRGLALCGAVSQAARSDLLMMRIHSTNTYLSTYAQCTPWGSGARRASSGGVAAAGGVRRESMRGGGTSNDGC